MPQLLSSPRCSGTRMLRWATVVAPTAVLLAGSLGTTGAYAAPGGNSAVHTAASVAGDQGNGGVGNGNGAGNTKHDDPAAPAMSTAASTTSSANSAAGDHQTTGTASTTGDVTEPQPLSTADHNSGGANGQCPGGPYCSTRDGSASQNGNGKGKATGKPCAGCVGKADNKNPKGQMPGGTDHNAGYECDRNHGVGRSNPAHTGCTKPDTCPPGTVRSADGTCHTDTGGGDCTTTPTAPGCTQGGGGDCTTTPTAPGCTQGGGGDCTTTPTTPGCTQGGGDCTTNPTAEGCTTTPPTTCPANEHAGADGTCVLGEKQTRKPTVQGEKVVKTPTSSLPMTGANVAAMLLAGLAGLGIGSALLVAGGRRRRSGS